MEIVKNEMIIKASDIMQYINDFCESQGLDPKQLNHSHFKAVCLAIGYNFFNDNTSALYIDNCKNKGIDFSRLNYVYNIYNSICMLYDKVPSILSFSYFINCDYWLLCNCLRYSDNKASSLACMQLLKNIDNSRENALKDRAIDKGGAVGVAIVGNQEYSWNDPKYRPTIQGAGSLEALPAFTSGQKAIE